VPLEPLEEQHRAGALVRGEILHERLDRVAIDRLELTARRNIRWMA
jgi:hypothetical protein